MTRNEKSWCGWACCLWWLDRWFPDPPNKKSIPVLYVWKAFSLNYECSWSHGYNTGCSSSDWRRNMCWCKYLMKVVCILGLSALSTVQCMHSLTRFIIWFRKIPNNKNNCSQRIVYFIWQPVYVIQLRGCFYRSIALHFKLTSICRQNNIKLEKQVLILKCIIFQNHIKARTHKRHRCLA